MPKASMLLGLLAIAAALAASGCGGDDDEDTTAAGGEAPSKQEFISEADAICRQGDKEIEQAAGREFGKGQEPSQQEQQQFVTDTVVPNIKNQIDEIRALTPPQGDEGRITAILDAAESGLDKIERNPSVLNEGGGGANPFAQANKLAGEYGLTACGG
jgi:hypothetical protein